VRATLSTLRSVVDLVRDRNLTFTAAGIAYYAFVSIVPMVLLAVTVASVLGGQLLADRVTGVLSGELSASGQQSVSRMLTDTTGREAASVVGLLALTWSVLKLFRGLDQRFDEVYQNEVRTSLPEQVRNAVVVIFGVGSAVVLVVGVGIVLSVLPPGIPFVDVLGTLALMVALVLAFVPVYYVLPAVDVSLLEVTPGTVVAAVGWVTLSRSDSGSTPPTPSATRRTG